MNSKESNEIKELFKKLRKDKKKNLKVKKTLK